MVAYRIGHQVTEGDYERNEAQAHYPKTVGRGDTMQILYSILNDMENYGCF